MSHKKAILFIVLGLLICISCAFGLYVAANTALQDSVPITKPFSMVTAYDDQTKIIRFQDLETGVTCYERNLKFSCVFVAK